MQSCDDVIRQRGVVVTDKNQMKALASLVYSTDASSCVVPVDFNALFGIAAGEADAAAGRATCSMVDGANRNIMAFEPLVGACSIDVQRSNLPGSLDASYMAMDRVALRTLRGLSSDADQVDQRTTTLQAELAAKSTAQTGNIQKLTLLQNECGVYAGQINELKFDITGKLDRLLSRLRAIMAFVIGDVGCSPWGPITGFPHNGAVKWIWNTPDARNVAPTQRPGVDPPVQFFKRWDTPVSVDGVMYCVVDNFARIFVNGMYVGPAADGGWAGGRPYRQNISMPAGLNEIRVEAYNEGGPAGLLLAVLNANGGAMLLCSDASWVFF